MSESTRANPTRTDAAAEGSGTVPAPDERSAAEDSVAVEQACLQLAARHRSAWSREIELRPWTETF